MFTPKIGEDEPILTNMFQMGWFNHQLAIALTSPFLQTFAMLLLFAKKVPQVPFCALQRGLERRFDGRDYLPAG